MHVSYTCMLSHTVSGLHHIPHINLHKMLHYYLALYLLSRALQSRPGEHVIDRFEHIEDTKGNNGNDGIFLQPIIASP